MITALLPIVLAFAAGWWLRRIGRLGAAHADGLLRLVARFGLPALILATVSRLPLKAELAWLPLIGALLVLLMWPLSWLGAVALNLPRAGRGVLVTGPMIMNLAFVYPLVVAWGDQAAIARLALIDFGNALLSFTLVYALAAWYGRRDARAGAALRGVLGFPPFWALCGAMVINWRGWSLPEALVSVLAQGGTLLVLLVPLALGVYFRPRLVGGRATVVGVGLRIGAGALLGWGCVSWFALDALSRTMVWAAALAPIGFNTLVFAAREGLDRELAASLASGSVPVAFILLPWLLWWQPQISG